MVKVPTFWGSSRPKCWPIGSSSLLKKRLANASLTIATGAAVSLSASVNARALQRHAEILQVVRADAIPRRAGVLTGLRRRMAGDENQLAPVVRQRVVG